MILVLEVLVIALLVLGPPALLVLRARRRVGDDLLAEWEAGSGVAVPEGERPAVRLYLVRWFQDHALGSSLGWVIGSLSPVASGPFAGLVLGHAAASILSELVAARRFRAPAVDGPARLEDHVPSAAIWALRATGAATVVVALVALRSAGGDVPRGAVAGALGVAAGCVTVEVLTRRLLARRGLGAPEVDAALRSATAHRLVGAGLAGAAVGLALVALSVGSGPGAPLRGMATVAVLATVAAAPWSLYRFASVALRRGRAVLQPQRPSLWRSTRSRPRGRSVDPGAEAADDEKLTPGGS